MVFHPNIPIRDLSQLICGFVVIVTAILVILKIHSKSKNKFAYTLSSFSLLMGSSSIGLAFTEAFR